MVVLHYTSIGTAAGALSWMRSRESQVSAHHLIDLDGAAWTLVDERERAWHAGAGSWRGDDDVNSRSIGIELVNVGHDGDPFAQSASPPYHPFPEPQMARLSELLGDICARWSIDPRDVVGHSDVAPTRKADPGEKFDWMRLARDGRAAALPPERRALDQDAAATEGLPADAETRFRAALTRAGYGSWPFDALLRAFRRRHRPGALDAPFQLQDVVRAERWAELMQRRHPQGDSADVV